MYVLKFSQILAGQCGSVVMRDRETEIRIRKVRVRTLGWDFLSF